jgi:adenylate kinase
MNLILFGAPGVGKGTQAELLAARLGIPHISTGAIFRQSMSSGSDMGKEVKDYLDKGRLVPDELTTRIAVDAISQEDAEAGFILDGFPRNTMQAESLVAALRDKDRVIDRVIYLTAPDHEIIARMLSRGRPDDNDGVIKTRLEVYNRETAPVLDYFRARGLVSEVNGVGGVNEVQERIMAAIGRHADERVSQP